MEEERHKGTELLQNTLKEAEVTRGHLNSYREQQCAIMWGEYQSMKAAKEAVESQLLQKEAVLRQSHERYEERATRYKSEKVTLMTRLEYAEDSNRRLAGDLAKMEGELIETKDVAAAREAENERSRIQYEHHVSDLSQEMDDLKTTKNSLVQKLESETRLREGLKMQLERYQAWDAQSPSRLSMPAKRPRFCRA